MARRSMLEDRAQITASISGDQLARLTKEADRVHGGNISATIRWMIDRLLKGKAHGKKTKR